MTVRDGAGPDEGAPRWTWVAYTVALLVLVGTWSLASPRMSGPDEPAHVIKAASVVRGQFRPPADPDGEGQLVRVPEGIARSDHLAICFAFRPQVTADCAPEHLPGGEEEVEVATQAGSYPPLYYLVVGWPTLVSQDADVLYAMRFLSAAASVALLVLATRALALLVGRRLAMAAMLVVVTPMVAFLSAVVNPNGLEVAAAIATWCTAMVVASRLVRGEVVGTFPAVGLAVAGGVLASTRWFGPVFVVLVLGCVALGTGLRPLAEALGGPRRERSVVLAGAVVAVAAVLAVGHAAWMGNRTLLPGAPVPPGDSAVEATLGAQQGYLRAMIGVFGWLDVPAPTLTYWVWLGLVGLLVLLAVAVGERRRIRAMALAALVTFLLPFSQVPAAGEDGLVWQGRYGLPVALGVVLLAITAVAEAIRNGRLRAGTTRSVALLAVPPLVGHVAAFYWAEHRYAVGLAGEADIWRRAHWAPPGGNVVLLVATTVALATVVLLALQGSRRGGAS